MAAAYMNLFLAIVCEVIATSCLKQSEQFTRLWPTLAMAAGYAAAFYFLSAYAKDAADRYCICNMERFGYCADFISRLFCF